MTTLVRPLAGLRVGLSVSESADLEARGFSRAGMNRFIVRFTRALLDAGATLAFGHDWRQAGIMEAVCRAALDSFGCPGSGDSQPLILNLIPWPDETHVDPEVLGRLRGILRIEPAGLPEDLGPELRTGSPDAQRHLRSCALTHLRRKLIRASQALVCVGGKEQGFAGRCPGIFEEAFLAFEAGLPVYVSGLLGGAAQRLGEAVFHGTELQVEGAPRFPIDLKNGLTREDNLRLLETNREDEALFLVLKGLRAHASRASAQAPSTVFRMDLYAR